MFQKVFQRLDAGLFFLLGIIAPSFVGFKETEEVGRVGFALGLFGVVAGIDPVVGGEFDAVAAASEQDGAHGHGAEAGRVLVLGAE